MTTWTPKTMPEDESEPVNFAPTHRYVKKGYWKAGYAKEPDGFIDEQMPPAGWQDEGF